jgi:mono/diheme cytochrome c family protein
MLHLRLLPLLAVPLLAGCGGGPADLYDPGWRHALRQDPVVLKAPDTHPTGYPPPGDFDSYLRDLPTRGGIVFDPRGLPADTRQRLTSVLDELFGTPADPRMPEPTDLVPDDLRKAAASYKARCVNCHGMSGDGRGPSAPWTTPYPRDFRSGRFKCATGAGVATGRPAPDDLGRVLRHGVPGTPMVATQLSDADIRLLVGYTVHLSVRGEVELELLKQAADDDLPADLEAEARRLTKRVLGAWEAARSPLPAGPPIADRPEQPTPEYHESLRRGMKVFATAGCLGCHERYGQTPTFRSDVWGLPNAVRNLTDRDRRWALADADLARQARHGIAAANMPAVPALNDADLTDLTNFVRELPYPKRLPADVLAEVEK